MRQIKQGELLRVRYQHISTTFIRMLKDYR